MSSASLCRRACESTQRSAERRSPGTISATVNSTAAIRPDTSAVSGRKADRPLRLNKNTIRHKLGRTRSGNPSAARRRRPQPKGGAKFGPRPDERWPGIRDTGHSQGRSAHRCTTGSSWWTSRDWRSRVHHRHPLSSSVSLSKAHSGQANVLAALPARCVFNGGLQKRRRPAAVRPRPGSQTGGGTGRRRSAPDGRLWPAGGLAARPRCVRCRAGRPGPAAGPAPGRPARRARSAARG